MNTVRVEFYDGIGQTAKSGQRLGTAGLPSTTDNA
jgi:hypothetical protein